MASRLCAIAYALSSHLSERTPYGTRHTGTALKLIKRKEYLKPWVNHDIKECIKRRHKLYEKYNSRPITFGNEYRSYRNHVNKLMIIIYIVYTFQIDFRFRYWKNLHKL